MPRTARIRSGSDTYHVILRGINRQRIFEEDEDYRRFLQTLLKYRAECGFVIYAWCLMPNHVHLLMREGKEPLSNVFRRIGASYVYWYNLKYERVGHLFQDRYRSEAVEDDAYFLTVVRYIHRNPVKAGLCQTATDYPYSSCKGYLDDGKLADSTMVREMLGREGYERFMAENKDDKCLDISDNPQRGLTDEKVKQILVSKYQCGNIAQFQELPQDKRVQAIRDLRKEGGSIRQISRLTGESFGVVRRIV